MDIQWSHQDVIEDARNAFIKLSESDRLLVINIGKLEDAEAEYNRIQNGIDEVTSAIHRIPDLESLTLADRHFVEEARRLYNSYDDKVTYYVNFLNVGELLDAEIKIERLEKLEADPDAKALVEKIEFLLNKDLTDDDIDTVSGLRFEYESLDAESRKLINFGLIEELEMRIAEL